MPNKHQSFIRAATILFTSLIVLLCSTRAASLKSDAPLRSVFDELNAEIDSAKSIREDMKNPGNLAWGESYILMSYMAMYEATRDTVYLDYLSSHFDLILKVRDDKRDLTDEYRKRVMPAWGSVNYTKGKHYVWLVHTGMITYPAATFVRVVYENKKLHKSYKAKADAYLKALEETVACFDDDWREGESPLADNEGYYFGVSLNKHLPLNQQNALGRTLIQLYAATKKEAYLEKATKLANFFKNRMKLCENGAYDWSYWPPLKTGPSSGEDISHAAINADFALLAYRNGIVLDEADVRRLAATFTKNIHKGQGKFAANVAGRGNAAAGAANQVCRWVGLSELDPEISKIVRAHLETYDQLPKSGPMLLGIANLLKQESK